MYIDLDIETEIIDAVNEYLSADGEVATYDELEALRKRIEPLEKEFREQNYWKADRNHTHKVPMLDISIEDAILNLGKQLEVLMARVASLENSKKK